jgi:hypothetical protein
MSLYDPQTESPTSIDTLERALAHLLLLAQSLYGTERYKEREGAAGEKLIDAGFVQAADGTTRMIFRGSLEIDPIYVTDTTQKLWMYTKEWGTVAVPAAWKVDA